MKTLQFLVVFICVGFQFDFFRPAFAGNLSSKKVDVSEREDFSKFEKWFSDPALTAVTREFGRTEIKMDSLPFRSLVAIADHRPWSSWWFPKQDDTLFSDSNSTLYKYDLFRASRYEIGGKPLPKSAVAYERDHYNSKSLSWEGLCDAWSLAALSKPEPQNPVTIEVGGVPITFSVADLKALLMKTYESIDESDLKYYGQKFTGDSQGWIYMDMFPDEFHRFLEIQLFEKRQAFMMDHDPGVAVWNVPVFKANYRMQPIPEDPLAVLVTAWVYSAEMFQSHEIESIGTREAVRTYHYILRGTQNSEGNLWVTSGEWVKGADGVNSIHDHPDFVTTIPDASRLTRKSANPEIEIALVDELLEKSYGASE